MVTSLKHKMGMGFRITTGRLMMFGDVGIFWNQTRPLVILSSSSIVKRARESSLGVKGVKMFNLLPSAIRNINSTNIDVFKHALDKFLTLVPDQPTVAGLGRAAESNCLLHQIPIFLLNNWHCSILTGWQLRWKAKTLYYVWNFVIKIKIKIKITVSCTFTVCHPIYPKFLSIEEYRIFCNPEYLNFDWSIFDRVGTNIMCIKSIYYRIHNEFYLKHEMFHRWHQFN